MTQQSQRTLQWPSSRATSCVFRCTIIRIVQPVDSCLSPDCVVDNHVGSTSLTRFVSTQPSTRIPSKRLRSGCMYTHWNEHSPADTLASCSVFAADTHDTNVPDQHTLQLKNPGYRVISRVRIWSGKRDSNSRPQPWQGCALPTELFPRGAKLYSLSLRCASPTVVPDCRKQRMRCGGLGRN